MQDLLERLPEELKTPDGRRRPEHLFNRYFTDNFIAVSKSLDYDDWHGYERGMDQAVLKQAQEHRDQHSNYHPSQANIILVHPFNPALSHSRYINEDQLLNYNHAIQYILQAPRNPEKLNIVAMESAHHYTYASSILLEQGHLDDVIFTQFNKGAVQEKERLSQLDNSTLYVLGSYRTRCAKSVFIELNAYTTNTKKYFVKDLTMHAPDLKIYEEDRHWLRTDETMSVERFDEMLSSSQ